MPLPHARKQAENAGYVRLAHSMQWAHMCILRDSTVPWQQATQVLLRTALQHELLPHAMDGGGIGDFAKLGCQGEVPWARREKRMRGATRTGSGNPAFARSSASTVVSSTAAGEREPSQTWRHSRLAAMVTSSRPVRSAMMRTAGQRCAALAAAGACSPASSKLAVPSPRDASAARSSADPLVSSPCASHTVMHMTPTSAR